MIQKEYLNDGTLVRYYSDAGMMLLQEETGIKYAEAIDPADINRVYIETDEPIEVEVVDEEIE